MKTQYPNLAIFSLLANEPSKSLLFRFLKFKISLLGEISPVKKNSATYPYKILRPGRFCPLTAEQTSSRCTSFRVGQDAQAYFTESAQQRSFSSKLVMLQPRVIMVIWLECDHSNSGKKYTTSY
jgi:hypothetical protein